MVIVKTDDKKHYRKNKKGRRYKIVRHTRKKRKLGKKIRYKDIGKFQLAHDEFGNFRGSRIIKYKKSKSKTKLKQVKPLKLKPKKPRKVRRTKPIKKSKRKRLGFTQNEIDTEYYLGNINFTTWMEARQGLTN